MLNHERWWNAIESFVLTIQQGKKIDLNEKQALLDEQYKTQVILEHSKPIEIGKIYPTETELHNDYPTAVSIIGMPNAGKTTTVNTIINTREFEIPELINEAYREEKEKLDSSNTFSYEELYKNLLIRQNYEFIMAPVFAEESISMGFNMEKLLIFDRLVWTDIPMLRAHFLIGNIGYSSLKLMENEFIYKLNNPNKTTNDVIISCLIEPNESLLRQSPDEGRGRIMNPVFLQILHEQYIRFHYEMINFKSLYKKDRPFTYSTIDMSNTDRFRALEKVINWSHIMQEEIFTEDSINNYLITD